MPLGPRSPRPRRTVNQSVGGAPAPRYRSQAGRLCPIGHKFPRFTSDAPPPRRACQGRERPTFHSRAPDHIKEPHARRKRLAPAVVYRCAASERQRSSAPTPSSLPLRAARARVWPRRGPDARDSPLTMVSRRYFAAPDTDPSTGPLSRARRCTRRAPRRTGRAAPAERGHDDAAGGRSCSLKRRPPPGRRVSARSL
jgi:hypothetical protein